MCTPLPQTTRHTILRLLAIQWEWHGFNMYHAKTHILFPWGDEDITKDESTPVGLRHTSSNHLSVAEEKPKHLWTMDTTHATTPSRVLLLLTRTRRYS